MELTPLLLHFVETGFKVAESQIREGKEIYPQLTLLANDEDGTMIVPVMITVDILGKKDSSRVASGLVRYAWEGILKERPHLKLLAITFMADGWTKTMPTADAKAQLLQGTFKLPSQSVGGTETIIVQLTLEKEDILYQWPYVRSEEGVVFSPAPPVVKSQEGPQALFMGLWPL